MKEALSGNFCRCISHYQVVRAVMAVLREGGDGMTETYRFIGKRCRAGMPGRSSPARRQFLDDIKLPGLLYGKVLRSPHPHALIKSIDKSRAETLPGVKAVLTWEDVPDWKGGTPRITRVLDRKVRYVGDAVALVAADSEEIAKEALRLIEVEYEMLPAVFDVEEALKPGRAAALRRVSRQRRHPRHPLLRTELPEGSRDGRCGKGVSGGRRHHGRDIRLREHAQPYSSRTPRCDGPVGGAEQG